MSTIIIQYDNPSDIYEIQRLARSFGTKTSTSEISRYISIDVFANLLWTPWDNTTAMRGQKYVRIIYELLEVPPESPRRFPGCYTIKLKRTVDEPQLTLDMLIRRR